MKKTFLIINILFILVSIRCAYSQNSDRNLKRASTRFINEHIDKIFDLKGDSVVIRVKRTPLILQEYKLGNNYFLSESVFNDYTQPVIGVDSEKIKMLLDVLDFDYLRSVKRDNNPWKRLASKKINVELTDAAPSSNADVIFSLSKPIFSKDRTYIIIMYSESCLPHLNCGSTSIKVFKKQNQHWEFFVYIPLELN